MDLGEGQGDLLVLPFTSYRAPDWNHGRKVLDPLPRYLEPNYVVNDQLAVNGRIVEGEDPRVPDVLAAIALPAAGARAVALAGLGIGAVALDRTAPTSEVYSAEVAGTVVHDGADLEVTLLDVPVAERDTPVSRRLVVGAGWSAFAALALLGLWHLFQIVAPRIAVRRPPG